MLGVGTPIPLEDLAQRTHASVTGDPCSCSHG